MHTHTHTTEPDVPDFRNIIPHDEFEQMRAIHEVNRLLKSFDAEAIWSVASALQESLRLDSQ
jgi:hypothetical protein